MSYSPPHSSASAALPKARAMTACRTAYQPRFPLGQYRPAKPGGSMEAAALPGWLRHAEH
jgi:hypothetical protein